MYISLKLDNSRVFSFRARDVFVCFILFLLTLAFLLVDPRNDLQQNLPPLTQCWVLCSSNGSPFSLRPLSHRVLAVPSLIHDMYVAERESLRAVPADGVTLGEVVLRGVV